MSELQSAIVLVMNRRRHILTVDNTVHGGVGMPGGKVEPDGETVVQAAIRELHEEVDLVAQEGDLRLIFVARVQFKRRDGAMGPERLASLYYARRVSGTPRALEEGTQLHWYSYVDLLVRSPFASYYRDALSEFPLQPTEGV